MNPAPGGQTSMQAEHKESAAYGRACVGCARAKCRCILRGEGLSCERCHRIRRTCEPAPLVRKRVSKRSGARAAADLQDKLDDLVTLLKQNQSQSQSGTGSTPSPSYHNAASTPASDFSLHKSAEKRSGKSCFAAHTEYHNPHPTWTILPDPASPPPPPDPSPAEAEEYFRIFKTTHVVNFPYISFSPDMTAAKMQAEWPFLWLTIRLNCCKSMNEKRYLELRVRQTAAQKLMIDLERSMDLLLGLISYLTWEKYQGRPILTLYSHLCLSLLTDLHIDRRVQELPGREPRDLHKGPGELPRTTKAPQRNNHERRALLGCFVACVTTSFFIKAASTTWTPHMEDCARHLMETPESPSDLVLVAQARLSRMLGDIVAAASWHPPEAATTRSVHPASLLHVKALRATLKDIKATTPDDILERRQVKSYMLVAQAMVNELPLYPVAPNARRLATIDLERTTCFYECVQAITECLDNFFSFTPAEMFAQPMTVHLHFSHCIHILYRLSLMDDPGWDRSAVSTSVDLLGMLERCAAMYAAMPASMGLETDGTDVYSQAAEVFRSTIPVWRRAMEAAGAIPADTGSGLGQQQDQEPMTGQELALMDMTMDGWFTDVFAMGDSFH
ncbi:Zn2/Cys6 DNA-binding protein [Sarocladium implicatum]|nr:Zn2/Cys6 DNA-binding protein [Sarocladium implicatum]